jgi:N-hydroxyarylamine O-acetyltransferase
MTAVTSAASNPEAQDAVEALDLPAYLDRIGVSRDTSRAPTVKTLRALHLGHSTTIPFENLDVLLGRPIRLDLVGLQAKLVGARRGGYCFEHNLLFAAALECLGFPVTMLAARVYMGPPSPTRPRTHMLLRVEAGGAPWLADVGFGCDGLLEPLPFEPGPAVSQDDRAYRIVAAGRERLMECKGPDGWFALYGFTLEPQELIDYVVASHYTSTHPNSPFVRAITVQRQVPGRRWSLRGPEYVEEGPEGVSRAQVVGDEAVLALLAEQFGLKFPSGTRFLTADERL